MTMLIKLKFTHDSPKDSESGIMELLIADSLESAIKYIDKKHLYGALKDYEDDEECGFYPDKKWWRKNEHKRQDAIDAGLSIDEYGEVTGDGRALTLWLNGTHWKDADDAYYGVTHHDWSEFQEVTEDEIAVLLKLGLVNDIRKKRRLH